MSAKIIVLLKSKKNVNPIDELATSGMGNGEIIPDHFNLQVNYIIFIILKFLWFYSVDFIVKFQCKY